MNGQHIDQFGGDSCLSNTSGLEDCQARNASLTAGDDDQAASERQLALNPGDDLVDVIYGKPSDENPVGERLARLHAIRRVVREFRKRCGSLRDFAAYIASLDIRTAFGFQKSEKISKDKLWRWVKQEDEMKNLDGRFYNRRRRMIVDKTCAIVIQIRRENSKAKPGAIMRMLDQRRKKTNDPEIVLPSMGSLKNLLAFLKKHRIPERLNAGSCGAFFKTFGIRIGHGWEYSNQSWGTDAAQSRISCWWNGGMIKPHVVAVVDCYSSMVVYAEMFPRYPGYEECLLTMMMAVLPKQDPDGFNYGGLTEEVRFDQHGQFHSKNYTSPLECLGIATVPIPVRQSTNNGKVERTFGTFRQNFEADFPAFIRRRGRFLSEDTMHYSPDFNSLRAEFHTWVRERRFSATSSEDGLTPYARWMAGLRPGHDPFPIDLQKRVKQHFVVWEDATVDGNCVVRSKKTGFEYTSEKLADMQGCKIKLAIGLLGNIPDVRANMRGHDLGYLQRTTNNYELANSLTPANLAAIEHAFKAGKALDKAVGNKKRQSSRLNDLRKQKQKSAFVSPDERVQQFHPEKL